MKKLFFALSLMLSVNYAFADYSAVCQVDDSNSEGENYGLCYIINDNDESECYVSENHLREDVMGLLPIDCKVKSGSELYDVITAIKGFDFVHFNSYEKDGGETTIGGHSRTNDRNGRRTRETEVRASHTHRSGRVETRVEVRHTRRDDGRNRERDTKVGGSVTIKW